MNADRFGHTHTVSSQPAIAAFEAATYATGAHRAIGDNLTRALELEPDLVSAWALRSVGNAMLARRETLAAAARDAAQAAEALSRIGGGTQGERALVEAARLTSLGRLSEAAITLEWHLDDEPLDFLALKLAHGLRFMTGQPKPMLETTTRVLRKWGDSTPGYGFVLGCHAFGLEEAGDYLTAEATGRRAVELEPSDAWGLHAVSHVMEMSGRTAEGIAWLGASRTIWPDCNNFRFHLAWHLALFHLELGNGPAVLDIYDREVMPAASDDFRDMANAVSLL
jgi:tetratricopeptide (TPR) repeat protein